MLPILSNYSALLTQNHNSSISNLKKSEQRCNDDSLTARSFLLKTNEHILTSHQWYFQSDIHECIKRAFLLTFIELRGWHAYEG